MKTAERNVVRLAVVQHLRAAYGIKTKNWNKCKSSKSTPGNAVKLDQAEECLSTALPSDVAALLKQFFRELPEPLLATDLQSSFLKAQELSTSGERTSATLLLSCVLMHESLNTLRYFCSFLKSVSQRSAENKMDSSNLSIVFAPNFFHWGDGTEKVNSSTEKRLKLQASVLQALIDNAQDLGVVPEFLVAKVPAMLGCDSGVFSPSDATEEGSTPSGVKRSRRSLGDMVNGALTRLKSNRTPSNTPQPDGTVISTGTPVIGTPKRKQPSESGHSYGLSNKKRRSIKHLGLELLPNSFFGGTSTPGSGTKFISKSEDNLLTPREAEEPGASWSRKTLDGITEHSFSDTPMKAYLSYRSEPTIVISKPAAISTIPKSLCCATSAESLTGSESFHEDGSHAGPNRLNTSVAVDECHSKSCTTDREEPKDKKDEPSSEKEITVSSHSSSLLQNSGAVEKNVETPQEILKDDISFGKTYLVPLSPLHIDSTLFEAAESSDLVKDVHKSSVYADTESGLLFRDCSAASADCSVLIDALDIQSPVAFRINSSITVQSTPFSGKELLNPLQSEKLQEPSLLEKPSESSNQHGAPVGLMERHKMKVADHVQRFNMLAINSPKAKARSPLKFHRTPVRQSVRRFNSLNQRKDNRTFPE
ncbi:rho GTPase-activating protein 11A-like isoform X1 [Clarias magur]|uniref:Rho GTPase-activating protein 11A-like isoform X1 n=1 Tax=Clarias magur TaxID=1594786 RepID=A0A8J4TL76_CLAMG|nr:rho GTPase-activating protein 11A-like isoform X1 [Clarias magur]